MSDETPDITPQRPYVVGPPQGGIDIPGEPAYRPQCESSEDVIPWYGSRAIISIIVALVTSILLLLKGAAVVKLSNEIISALVGLVSSIATAMSVYFTRINRRRVVSGKEYRQIRDREMLARSDRKDVS